MRTYVNHEIVFLLLLLSVVLQKFSDPQTIEQEHSYLLVLLRRGRFKQDARRQEPPPLILRATLQNDSN
jgi:hypothetical protein